MNEQSAVISHEDNQPAGNGNGFLKKPDPIDSAVLQGNVHTDGFCG